MNDTGEIEVEDYFDHLVNLRPRSYYYRKYFLYPRIRRLLKGQMLDVGCGLGTFITLYPEVIGIDINKNVVKYCRSKGCKAELIEGGEYPFEENTFDSVLLDNVIEHFDDPSYVLEEIARVLKPRGYLVVGVPGIKGYDSHFDHKTYYDEGSLVQTLRPYNLRQIGGFYTPVKSEWLSRNLNPYCFFGQYELS